MEWLKKLPQNSAVGAGVFLLVLLLVIMSKRLYERRKTNPAVLKKAALCVRRGAKDAFQAQQATNPLLALTNANYALAYLNIARDLALYEELSAATNIPIDELREDVEAEEQRARDRVLKLCPQLGVTTRAGIGAGYKGRLPPPQQAGSQQQAIRPPVSSDVALE